MTRSLFEMIILLAISIAVSFAGNAINPVGIPLFGQWSAEEGSIHGGGPCAPDTNEITDIDMMDLYLSSDAVFVDARSSDEYNNDHIPRSVNLPLNQIQDDIYIFMDKYPLDTKIITYCSGVDCHDSHELAEILSEYNYSDVVVYSRGLDKWKEEGRPTESLQTEGTE